MSRSIVAVFMLLFVAVPALAEEQQSYDFVSDVKKESTALVHEAADLVTKPVDVEHGGTIGTLAVLGATGLTYAFDSDIKDKLQGIKGRGLDRLTDAGSLAGDPLIHLGFAAVLYSGGAISGSQKTKDLGEELGEALILADTSSYILKDVTGRGRPRTGAERSDFRPLSFKSDYDSFPSMHTASSFAMASVMSSQTDSVGLKALYYSAASFVGFSRMYQKEHWASDVVFGAVLGEVCGRIAVNYRLANGKIAMAPMIVENGGGLALTGHW